MSKLPKKIVARMYSSLRKIEVVSDKEDFATFIHPDSWMIQDAVIRRFIEISYISELLIEKYNYFCEVHPEIPFKELSGMKKYLTKIQDGSIDLALVWQTVQKIIPDIIDKIEAIFKKLR